MGFLFRVVKLAAGATAQLVGAAVIKALLPRMPPPNWNPSRIAPVAICPSHSIRAKCLSEYKRRSFLSIQDDKPEYLLDSEGPNSFNGQIDLAESEQGDTTLCSMDDSPVIDFSVFSDDSSLDLNKAALIAPSPPCMFDLQDMNQCTLLMEASARISEILRENRRRLDTGEDPCISRREARRKRAQEICAARKARFQLL